jgi:poly-gamma-glutamate capsule biosynthesis protein CapA/YwtB (metallophosphatase superfamily)
MNLERWRQVKFRHEFLLLAAFLALATAGCHQQPGGDAAAQPTAMTIGLAGDTGLGLAVEAGPWIAEHGYHQAFTHLREHIKRSDFFVVNLETAIVPPELATVFGKRRPRQPPEVAKVLADEGIDAMGLANNHMMDFGPEGLAATLENLAAAGVDTFGAGSNLAAARRPLLLEKDGVTVAIVAGCRPRKWALLAENDRPGVAPLTERRWKKDIAAAKKIADVVIAFPHWGHCYSRKLTDEQKELARAAVDAGADLVIGHHSHIPQTVEMIDGTPVFYSVGNFLFHGVRREKREKTLKYDFTWIAEVAVAKSGVKSVTVRALFNHNMKVDFTPRPVNARRAQRLFARLLPAEADWWRAEADRVVVRPVRR